MQTLIEGFSLGLIGGMVPGSILTILLVSVIQGGFPAGLRAFLWSLAAELTVVGILLIILFNLPISAKTFNYIGMIGGLVLFYFAWQIFHLQKIDQPEKSGAVFSGKEIYTLAATNAPLYIFWLTVCAPLIWRLAEQWPLGISAISFMAVFEIGWSLSTFTIMLLFVKARKYLTNPRIMRKIYIGASMLMFLLGVRMLYLSVSLL
jgi:threonine/homoserine/homoserine lactone efflux protein